MANPNPNNDEFSESGEESCYETDEDDKDFNSNTDIVGAFILKWI